jgi:hypothetical protein
MRIHHQTTNKPSDGPLEMESQKSVILQTENLTAGNFQLKMKTGGQVESEGEWHEVLQVPKIKRQDFPLF